MPPESISTRERALQSLLPALVAERLVESAHDLSEGGLAVALAECCFDTGGLGVSVDVLAATGEAWVAGAGDERRSSANRRRVVVVSAAADNADAVVARARAAGVPVRVIGDDRRRRAADRDRGPRRARR